MNKARNKYWSALRNLLRTQSFSARADEARTGILERLQARAESGEDDRKEPWSNRRARSLSITRVVREIMAADSSGDDEALRRLSLHLEVLLRRHAADPGSADEEKLLSRFVSRETGSAMHGTLLRYYNGPKGKALQEAERLARQED